MVRTGAEPVYPLQAPIPAELVADYLPDRYVPIVNQTTSFLSLDPQANYLAIRNFLSEAILGQKLERGLYIFEVVNPVVLGTEVKLAAERPFVRIAEGQIAFRPVADDEQRFRGILRMLIREGSEL